MKTLIIDNYDSFTFNLYQYIAEITGEEPVVIRNNQLTIDEVKNIECDNIIISPGPGRPDVPGDFGICGSVLLQSDKPILGVCLGHQGAGYVYGCKIIHAPCAMHGRLSRIYHNGNPLFADIPNGFAAVRYHSLILDAEIPAVLDKIAWTGDGTIMGIAHNAKPIWGVQFHPESICTEYGKSILKNFCRLTGIYNARNTRAGKPHNESGCGKKVTVVPGKLRTAKTATGFKVCVRALEYYREPEQVFLHFYCNDENAVWLDSSLVVEGFSRFSYMGGSTGDLFFKVTYDCCKKEITVIKKGITRVLSENIYDYLNREIDIYYTKTPGIEFDFNCGFAGYFGYESNHAGNAPAHAQSELPDAVFLFLDRLLVFDHTLKKMYLLNLVESAGGHKAEQWFDGMEQGLSGLKQMQDITPLVAATPVQFSLSRDYNTYIDDIAKCFRYINEGDSYEICLTNKITACINPDPLSYYRVLRKLNPAPYGAFLRFNTVCIAGSSPERFITVDKERVVESKPMKGTIKRGGTEEEDKQLRSFLESDEKTKSENLMICDLVRNDLGIVCEIGSIDVPELMVVETYATVHQMISSVRGKLRKDLTAIDCIRAAFPGGSMTGAPRQRTMKIIDSLEKEPRGVYSGAIGYFALNESADFNIVIRTAVVTPGKFTVGIGGAIVALSDPEEEFGEIMLKGKVLLNALQHLIPAGMRKEYIVKGIK